MASTNQTETEPSFNMAVQYGSSARNPQSSLPVHPAVRTSPQPPSLSWGDPKRPLYSGPPPVKGSGQDRFRQALISAGPVVPSAGHISTSYMSTNAHLLRPSLHTISIPASTQARSLGGVEPTLLQHGVIVNPKMYPEAAGFKMPNTNMNYQAAVPAATRRDGLPTGQPAGDRDVTNGSMYGNNTPKPTKVTWSALLSAECQKRRFNPSFYGWVTGDGGYRCSVNIDGVTVYDNRGYDTPDAAKQAVAKRAVEHVRIKKAVPPGPPNRACNRIIEAAEKMAQEPQKMGSRDLDIEKHLVARVLAQFGHLAGPGDVTMENPVASRAFLEGFAIGCKVQASSLQENAPKANYARNRAYRDRSRVPSPRGHRSPRARDRPAQDDSPQGHLGPALDRGGRNRRPLHPSRGRRLRSPHTSRSRNRRTCDRNQRTRTMSPVRTQRHSTIV